MYVGSWDYGFFSLAAVGATNVGSIRVFHDKVTWVMLFQSNLEYDRLCICLENYIVVAFVGTCSFQMPISKD